MASKTQYLYNDSEQNLLSTFSTLFKEAERVDCAIAFLTLKGWQVLKPLIEEWIMHEPFSPKQLRLLVRKDYSFPDMRAVDDILNSGYAKIRLYPSESFHLKKWIFYYPDKVRILIGSSNFTEQGLKHNIEANILTEMSLNEPSLKQIQTQFERYWHQGTRLGDNDMELSGGMKIVLKKVEYADLLWIDKLFKDNSDVFNYQIQSVTLSNPAHLENMCAQSVSIDFSDLNDKTIAVMTALKEKFNAQKSKK